MHPINTAVRLSASGFTGTVTGIANVCEDGVNVLMYVILLDAACQGYLTPEGRGETFIRLVLAHPDGVIARHDLAQIAADLGIDLDC